MTAREIIRELNVLLLEWADDPEVTTADYVCVRADTMLAAYLKRPPIDYGGKDDDA